MDFYKATGLTPRQAQNEPLRFIEKLLLVATEEAETQRAQIDEMEDAKKKMRREKW